MIDLLPHFGDNITLNLFVTKAGSCKHDDEEQTDTSEDKRRV
jgi:hypothetical protein